MNLLDGVDATVILSMVECCCAVVRCRSAVWNAVSASSISREMSCTMEDQRRAHWFGGRIGGWSVEDIVLRGR